MQWYGCFLPRIHSFLPASTILEIAPGFGRWTRFLKQHCDRLIGVDLSEKCVSACRERFADSPKVSFILNDGRSLRDVEDESVDLAISLDSLVHAEADAVSAYVDQLGKKLRVGGHAVLHHSNLGRYRHYRVIRRIRPLDVVGQKMGLVESNLHSRSLSVTGDKVRGWAAAAGLRCVSQEYVNWGTRRALIDCFSVLVRDANRVGQDPMVLRNRKFMEEADHLVDLARLYGGNTGPGAPFGTDTQ
jgi:2-polyprenyl-3-methyl-5-hydroxy-6-metoxy-1,4-benzoquinol methylase